MIIGVPKEIKNHEYRVGMVPASVRELVHNGHDVIVEKNAGMGIGFSDEDYKAVGASIGESAASVFEKADMIVKVKEPQAVECKMLREGQILFTYLHLAPDLPQTQGLIDSKAICIAYETVTDVNGGLPLLAPMSEVAGRMAIQAGAQCLEKSNQGLSRVGTCTSKTNGRIIQALRWQRVTNSSITVHIGKDNLFEDKDGYEV